MRFLLVNGATTFLDAMIPPGAYDPVARIGWQQNGSGTKWTYKDPVGVLGIRKLAVGVVASTPGKIKFAVKGKDGSYAPPGIPVTAVLVIDVPDAPTGQCAQASFPGPAPACAFNGSGSTLQCK